MYCEYGKYIEKLLDGKLNEKKEKELRNHAEKCFECSDRLHEIEHMDSLIKRDLTEYPYESKKQIIMDKIEEKKLRKTILSAIFNLRKYSYGIVVIFVLIISILLVKPLLINSKLYNKNNYYNTTKQGFEIYLVKPESEYKAKSYGHYDLADKNKYIEGPKVDVNSLVLEEKPILTDKDISYYYWNKHEIELTKEYLKKTSISDEDWKKSGVTGGSQLLKTSEKNAFVVVLNGKKIYSGGFPLSIYSSQCPCEIGISDVSSNKIAIWNNRSYDSRANKGIYNFFKSQGKLIE